MKRILSSLCVLAVAVAASPVSRAQAPAPVTADRFEVASIKPSNPNPASFQASLPLIVPALGRLQARNMTLRLLIVAAYQKQSFQVIGGPGWLNTTKFDVNARADDPKASTTGLLEMLQGLLADRFKLRVHPETRQVPIYALMLARSGGRLGPQLKPSTANCPGYQEQQQKMLEAIAKGGIGGLTAMMSKPGESKACGISPAATHSAGVGIRLTGMPILMLTEMLTQLVGRPVVDKTGLNGLYDYEITIDVPTLMRMYAELGVNLPSAAASLPDEPSLMTNLQEKLGLKLDAQRGPGQVLVVDSAAPPTPD
jgi:uncharacterized protein (TIGR03435 family)